MRSFVSTVVLGLVLAQSVGAQSVIRGRVVADSSLSGLAGADVFVSSVRVAITDNAGRFVLSVQPGVTRLDLRRLGFAPLSRAVEVGRGETLAVALQMLPMPVSMDTISVQANAGGAALLSFEERRKRGIGRFLADSALRAHEHTASLSTLLRRWGIGILVTRGGGEIATTARGPTRISSAPCPMQVFLDGIMLDRYNLREFKVADLAGVEYYAGGAQTPVIFEKGNASCGVLVLWTHERIR